MPNFKKFIWHDFRKSASNYNGTTGRKGGDIFRIEEISGILLETIKSIQQGQSSKRLYDPKIGFITSGTVLRD